MKTQSPRINFKESILMNAVSHTLLAAVVALSTSILSNPAQASLPPVAFADAKLEAAIRGALAKPTGPLTTNDLILRYWSFDAQECPVDGPSD
ncbi:MAG: hypothetical protein NTW03_01960 [Verrucomicrobia bacterium]|nr:hypothetical protein [Verrucomicrobiota bacterium]